MRELTESYVSNVVACCRPIGLGKRSARSKLRDEEVYLNIQNELKIHYSKTKAVADTLAQQRSQESELKHQAQLSEAIQTEVELQNKSKNEQRLRMCLFISRLALLLMGSAVFSTLSQTKN